MLFRKPMVSPESPDVALVSASLSGNREAFAFIVSRYQSLICSLAYSATGNLTLSEDLAQETFVTAWKELSRLKEPQKLRSWICGIARNVINNFLRREGTKPIHTAEPLDAAKDIAASEPAMADKVIAREEEAILWRSLAQIPETYREPLVLFYREGQSIDRVAAELELTEEAVRQRLTRGRRLLAEEVTAFVEGTLKRSAPGTAFTLGVIAAIPALNVSATAATLGATAAKGSTTAKAAGLMGLFGAIVSPILAIFGTWVGYKMSLADANSDRERAFVRTFHRRLTAIIICFTVLFAVLMFGAKPILHQHPRAFVISLFLLTAIYLGASVILAMWSFRIRRTIIRDAQLDPAVMQKSRPVMEYRSDITLFGLPLYHLRLGGGVVAQKPVKAWIAVGDCAFGGLFAFGGFAIAPISVGGCAIGLLPFGGCAIGLLPLGGLAMGLWSFGGFAIGWLAYGGCALAWKAAFGGTAIAHDFALGGLAHALSANNEVAKTFVQEQPFFRVAQVMIRHLAWMNLPWVIAMVYWWKRISKEKDKTGK